jgi:hypothetical protein
MRSTSAACQMLGCVTARPEVTSSMKARSNSSAPSVMTARSALLPAKAPIPAIAAPVQDSPPSRGSLRKRRRSQASSFASEVESTAHRNE